MRISDWSSDVCSSDLACCTPEFADDLTAHSDLLSCAALASIGADQLRERLLPTYVRHLSSQCVGHSERRYQSGVLPAVLVGGDCFRRSEARRVGKDCVSPCRCRWSRDI